MTEQTPMPLSPPPLPPSHQPRRKKWKWVVGALLVLAALYVLSPLLSHSSLFSVDTRGVDEFPDLKETWSYGKGDVKVARIDITGVIMQGKQGHLFSLGKDPVETALRKIRTASQDKTVKAIILEVDSPGGGITASDIIYNELKAFKKSDPSRKIVALLGDMAASGGYYVASAADVIVAHPTTITGSIGVLISALNLKGFGDKYGVKTVTIASGKNKDMLNPFKDLTEEQQKLLQGTIDEMFKRFVDIVAESRSLPRDEVLKVADGRILTATEALQSKLIDRVGYWNDAFAETCTLLKADSVKVVKYQEATGLAALFEAVQNIDVSVQALQGSTRLYYLCPL